MSRGCHLRAFAWLLLSVGAAATASAAGYELIGGWEGESDRGYGFLMPVVIVDLEPRRALVVSGSLNHLRYPVPGPGGVTEVESPGADFSLGYRWRKPRLTATFGPGFSSKRTTRRAPNGVESRETESGLTAQGTLFVDATPLTNLNLIASYSDANEYLWSRAGAKRRLTNRDSSRPRSLLLGVELTLQGNDEVESRSLGGLLEIAFHRARGSLQLRTGYSDVELADGSTRSEPYLGVGFYKAF